jgi:hypothetical protein
MVYKVFERMGFIQIGVSSQFRVFEHRWIIGSFVDGVVSDDLFARFEWFKRST